MHFSYHQLSRHVPIPGSFGSRSPPFSNFEDENHTNWKKSSMQVSICAEIVSSGLSALPNQRKMNQFLEPLLWTNFLAALTGLEYLEKKVSWKKNLSGKKFVSTNYTFTILARKPNIIFWEFWLWIQTVKFEPQKNVPVLLVWNVHLSNLIV